MPSTDSYGTMYLRAGGEGRFDLSALIKHEPWFDPRHPYMSNDDFNFLLYRSEESNLLFVSLDSIVGYIRKLSVEMDKASDLEGAKLISVAFEKLSEIIEGIEDK